MLSVEPGSFLTSSLTHKGKIHAHLRLIRGSAVTKVVLRHGVSTRASQAAEPHAAGVSGGLCPGVYRVVEGRPGEKAVQNDCVNWVAKKPWTL